MDIIKTIECGMEQTTQWESHSSRQVISFKCVNGVDETTKDVRQANKVYRCAGLKELAELILFGVVSQTDGEHGFAPNRDYCENTRYFKENCAVVEYQVGPGTPKRKSLTQMMTQAGWGPNNESGCQVWGIGTQTKMTKPTGWGSSATWGNPNKDPYVLFWSSLRNFRVVNLKISHANFKQLRNIWTRRKVWFNLVTGGGNNGRDLLNVNPVCNHDMVPITRPCPQYKPVAFQSGYSRHQMDRGWAMKFSKERKTNPNINVADVHTCGCQQGEAAKCLAASHR